MHYQQHCLPYSTDPVPTLLTVDYVVFAKHQAWIGKYARCGFKINTGMLLLVCPVLLRIPLEAHAVIHNV